MKNKIKKSISLLLSLLMIFSCMSVIGSAVTCNHDPDVTGSTVTYLYTVDPTCVEGYDVYTCSVCKKELHLHEKAPVNPHDYKFYETVKPTCTKKGYTLVKCAVCSEIVADPNSYTDMIPHTYSEITYTPFGVDDRSNQLYKQHALCSACGITYDDTYYYKVELQKNILKDGEETAVSIGTYYAKKDGPVYYFDKPFAAENNPTLTMDEYDNDFGAWDFDGWSRTDGDRTDLDMVSEPMTATAKFKPRGVAFDVSFLDYYGKQIGETQNILYKGYAVAPEVTARIPGNHVTHVFEGWDKEFDCVRSNLVVRPVYSTEVEQVTVVFFDYDRSTEIKRVDCNWGTQIAYISPNLAPRPADDGYVYEFTGMWANAEGNQQRIAENEYMSLYPIYVKNAIKYTTVINVLDEGLGAPKASYQVIASNGNLAAAGYTNESGRATVYLSKGNYTVKCASADKLKAGDTTFAINTAGGSTAQTNVRVDLVENSEYYEDAAKKCMCICHSIVGPIWIKILNLLYSLFNIRYVCCNDMFATHGDKLKYTA
ncbi:MAG: hypothetical protein MJ177_04770 [Clostridia bacterium]|nr:hypothetical protein [Clostridia bacterium]